MHIEEHATARNGDRQRDGKAGKNGADEVTAASG